MPTSSLRRPLKKTYRIERVLCDEHNQRMKRAIDTWGGMVCPSYFLALRSFYPFPRLRK